MDKSSDNRSRKEKRQYQKPRLRRHGRISRITASGSGAMQEMGAMGGMDLTRFS